MPAFKRKNVLICLVLDFILFILSIPVNSGLGLKSFFDRDGQDIQDGQAKGIGEWGADLLWKGMIKDQPQSFWIYIRCFWF